ncbi:hypothetical protein [Streptomyces sp. NPDC088141]|uniref:hypothetical protein n=1 Tax=unclassified Streptomyces TaxID=2593676 RepID=UPI00343D89A9
MMDAAMVTSRTQSRKPPSPSAWALKKLAEKPTVEATGVNSEMIARNAAAARMTGASPISLVSSGHEALCCIERAALCAAGTTRSLKNSRAPVFSTAGATAGATLALKKSRAPLAICLAPSAICCIDGSRGRRSGAINPAWTAAWYSAIVGSR